MRPGWPVALRLARRNARRARGRTALIVSMVSLPVLGVAAGDVLVRSLQLDPGEAAVREAGQADVVLQWKAQSLSQDSFIGWSGTGDGKQLARRSVLHLLPTGSRTVEAEEGEQPVTTPNGRTTMPVSSLVYDDPILVGMLHQLSGRAPQSTGEVDVTPAALRHLGGRIGDRIASPDGHGSWLVVGTVRSDKATREERIYARPGTFPTTSDNALTYVDVPGQMSWPQLEKLNDAGYVATAGHPLAGSPRQGNFGHSYTQTNVATIGALLVVIVLVLLEVSLMAGAAFAVGLRRQTRELGVLAAAGADGVQMRRVVLAGGLELGVVGGVVGTALGLGLGSAVLAWLGKHLNTLPGHLDIRPSEIGGAALLGLVAGLAAAALPARTAARLDVVAALTGRRAAAHVRARVPIAGVVMIGVGVVFTMWGARPPNPPYAALAAGLVVTQLGFVVCAPSLLGLVGRLGRHLPMLPRMAIREMARHRARSGAAVGAVLVAVAGTVAVGVFATSQDASGRAHYQSYLPLGSVAVGLGIADPTATAPDPAAIAAVLRRELPASRVGVIGEAMTQVARTDGAGGCAQVPAGSACMTGQRLLAGDVTALRAVLGRTDTAAEAAFAAGSVVIFDPAFTTGSQVVLESPRLDAQNATPSTVTMPAVLVPIAADQRTMFAVGIMPTATARRMGVYSNPQLVVAHADGAPAKPVLDRVRSGLAAVGVSNGLTVERGYTSNVGKMLLVLLAASSLVTVGGVAIATGLAAADGRDGLATLAAVGAGPRVRRLLTATEAGGIAVVGSVVGVVAGMVPAIAMLRARGNVPLVVPWSTLLVASIAVPVAVSALSGLLVHNRLPLERRAN